jgi:YVTN family beta-propeller protein
VSVKISLAGRVSIESNGVLIDEERFPGRQGRLVFVYLVSEHGRPVFRDELADALWGEKPPATWEKALGVIASKLRVLLGECGLDGAKALTNAFGCYRLELPAGSWVDLQAAAHSADQAAAALAAGRPEEAKAEATLAASLARLPFLSGEDGVWVERKRRERADVLGHALDCLADACLSSGDASEAAKWADEAIALEPFLESGYRRLMHAHAAAGNSAEALRAYDRCRRLLADELGAYPSPETESIYRELLSTAPADARAAIATPETPAFEHETTSRRRPSRMVIAGATLAAAAAGTALGVVLTHGGRSTAGASVDANAVGLIDVKSGKITSQIPVGIAPTAVAGNENAIWVTSADGNSVSRIDPRTNDVRQTIDVGGGPAGVAVTPNGVWVANSLDGTVSRIDPETNQVVQTIVVGNGPTGVASGENAVWVTKSVDGTVSRIDPNTGRVTTTLAAAIGASGVAVAFHRIWIVSPPSGSVVALDPGSGQVLQRIGVGVDPNAVAVSGNAVWVANRADGTVSKFDPRTGSVTDDPGRSSPGRHCDGTRRRLGCKPRRGDPVPHRSHERCRRADRSPRQPTARSRRDAPRRVRRRSLDRTRAPRWHPQIRLRLRPGLHRPGTAERRPVNPDLDERRARRLSAGRRRPGHTARAGPCGRAAHPD